MLTELYEYALRKNLAARPGFKPKRVKAYIELSKNGEFLGVSVREKSAPSVYAPDIGAAANGFDSEPGNTVGNSSDNPRWQDDGYE